MSNHRYSKFWWQDWQRDGALRMCSLAARGLWMDILCIAHDGTPTGHVTVNGKAPNNRQLAAIVGATEREISKTLTELEEAGVFSRTDEGVIFSRRMVRDALKSDEGATQVEKRWGTGEESGKSRSQRLSAARRKGTHTHEEWEALMEIVGPACPRCSRQRDNNGGGFVKDHITPIYLGGSNAIDNIQPLCQGCNAQKGKDATDHRPKDWKERLQERLGKRLPERVGSSDKTPTLYSESESESEPERHLQKEDNLSSFNRNSRAQSDVEAPERPNQVEKAFAGVVTDIRKAMQPTTYPPRKPIRDVQEQIAAVEPARQPKTSHLSPNQLAAARRRTS